MLRHLGIAMAVGFESLTFTTEPKRFTDRRSILKCLLQYLSTVTRNFLKCPETVTRLKGIDVRDRMSNGHVDRKLEQAGTGQSQSLKLLGTVSAFARIRADKRSFSQKRKLAGGRLCAVFSQRPSWDEFKTLS